jgi:DNA-binding response OmpR family regulator
MLELSSQEIVTLNKAELEALIEEIVWRHLESALATPQPETQVVRTGKLVIDVLALEASVMGRPLSLKPQECRLLIVLAKHLGQVLTREQLLELAWPEAEKVHCNRTVDVHIRRLRTALKSETHLIVTVLQHGYKLIRVSD